ncbi:MAG: exosortase/archaeosortase family protein [Nitrospinota bacterium]
MKIGSLRVLAAFFSFFLKNGLLNTIRSGIPLGAREKFFLLVVLSELLFLYAPTMLWLISRWTTSVWQNMHGIFLPPLFLYLIWEKFHGKGNSLSRQSSPLGFFFLVPALLILSLDAAMKTQILSAVSLFIAIPGLFLLFLGKERTKAVIFPLLLLGFMLPVPLAAIEQLNLLLRKITTFGISFLFPAFQIPFFVEGTTIFIPGEEILVGDACSGFSTLYAMIVVAFVISHWCREFKKRVAVLVLSAPVAIFANILRTTSLVLLVHWKGAEILNTFIHPLSGIIMFMFGLAVIFAVVKNSGSLF